MDMIIIAYWTQTGNTKAMAEAVGEGVEIAPSCPSTVT